VSAAPFDVELVRERLTAADLLKNGTLRSIDGAADYHAVKSLRDFPAPCAYLVLAREKAISQQQGVAPAGQQVPSSQIAYASFAVVVAVRNYREQRGEQVAQELKTVLAAIRGALIGWVPNLTGARACQFVQGDMQDYDSSVALWADIYQTQHIIKGAAR
jgi:hypothetical protein